MAKPGARAARARAGQDTRARLVEAAIQTLKAEGYAGASARAIARAAGLNQALIFYYFGNLTGLLLAALDQTSARRLARYREALDGVQGPGELLRVARELFQEDLESGHITVLAEMISASSSVPELRTEVVARIAPWIQLAEGAMDRFLDGSSLQGLLPARDVAFAVVAFYLGVELLTHLEGDHAHAEALFDAAARILPLVEPFLGHSRGNSGAGDGGQRGPST
jgi:AcrR family transcriptional regulator